MRLEVPSSITLICCASVVQLVIQHVLQQIPTNRSKWSLGLTGPLVPARLAADGRDSFQLTEAQDL